MRSRSRSGIGGDSDERCVDVKLLGREEAALDDVRPDHTSPALPAATATTFLGSLKELDLESIVSPWEIPSQPPKRTSGRALFGRPSTIPRLTC